MIGKRHVRESTGDLLDEAGTGGVLWFVRSVRRRRAGRWTDGRHDLFSGAFQNDEKLHCDCLGRRVGEDDLAIQGGK